MPFVVSTGRFSCPRCETVHNMSPEVRQCSHAVLSQGYCKCRRPITLWRHSGALFRARTSRPTAVASVWVRHGNACHKSLTVERACLSNGRVRRVHGRGCFSQRCYNTRCSSSPLCCSAQNATCNGFVPRPWKTSVAYSWSRPKCRERL